MTDKIDHGYYCSNCRFSQKDPDDRFPECHRYPPSRYEPDTDSWFWPEVQDHDTCGEWKPVYGDTEGYATDADGKPIIPSAP